MARLRAPAETLAATRFYLDHDMPSGETHVLAAGRAAVFSARCPDKTTANEDAAALFPLDEGRAVLAVADGVGGQPAGDRAAALALESLAGALENVPPEGELRGAILDGIESANRAVLALGVGAATTLAVAEIDRGTLRPYHVGDAEVLVIGQRGRIKLQTLSHAPVSYAVEAGVLDAREAIQHEDRHLVSNLVGSPEMRIELGTSLALAPRDTVLVASDGLLDNLLVEEIAALVRAGPLDRAAESLAAETLRRMRTPSDRRPSKPDDLTFILFRRR